MSKRLGYVGARARRKPFATAGMLAIVLTAVALALILIPAGAAGPQPKKVFTATVNGSNPAPAAPAGATNVKFVLVLANSATSPNQLGSANVTPPSGFTITGAQVCSDPQACTSTLPLPSGSSASFPANPLQLRNINIAAGSSKAVVIQATTPCAASGAQWKIDAKQSNDFSGPPGNTFDNSPQTVPQTLSGGCKLAFVEQPADTAVGTAVRTTRWASVDSPASGNPLVVGMLNGNSVVAAPNPATVTISISGTGCSFTDSTTSVSFSGGFATFSNLKPAGAVGSPGCQLTASAPGYADSDLTSSFYVDPIVLVLQNQPADTPVKTAITTTKWGSIYNPATGSAISVGAQVVSGRDSSTKQLTGSGTIAPAGTVAISAAGCSLTGDSTATNVAFSGATALFSNLKPAAVATGCHLQAVGSSAGYSDSAASSSFNADPVELYFTTQPKDSVVNTVARDVKNGGTVNPAAGNPINVGVQVRSQADSSTQQLSGSGTVAPSGTVAMQALGSGCAFTNDSTTSGVAFSNGIASFSNLKMANVVNSPGCQLKAVSSSAGYADSAASSSFVVSQSGVYCPDPANCTLPPTSDGSNHPNSTSVTTSGFNSITLNYDAAAVIPPDVLANGGGCAGFVIPAGGGSSTTGGVISFDPASGFQGVPNITVVHTVNKFWIHNSPNNGNPFVDMCVGVVRVDRTTGSPLYCNPQNQTDSTGLGGWVTRNGTAAVCASDGLFWGFLGNPQQSIPATDPKVTAWTGLASGDRQFTISLGTVAVNQAWYFDYKFQP